MSALDAVLNKGKRKRLRADVESGRRAFAKLGVQVADFSEDDMLRGLDALAYVAELAGTSPFALVEAHLMEIKAQGKEGPRNFFMWLNTVKAANEEGKKKRAELEEAGEEATTSGLATA